MSPQVLATSDAKKEQPALGDVLKKAAMRALPSGAAGSAAMGLNIATLMWLRTTVNYQYRYGTGTMDAIKCVVCRALSQTPSH